MPVFCNLCRQVLHLDRPHYHQEIGWSRPRGQGGTNGLRLREETGKFAHIECVDLAKRKISVNQGKMF